jgi:RHS repeat-associated protein
VKNSVVTKYYFAGATRLAVRTNGTLSYLLGDHLGSSSVTTDANGAKTATALYKAFGETRYTLGNLGTDYKFTGQRLQAELGIYWFQSRWMDPSLGRFTQPDTIVPTSTQGTQAWDRYAFVNNNPVRYNDPTGHWMTQDDGGGPDTCTDPLYCDNKKPASPSLVEIRKIYNDIADESDIPFNYPKEACWARAHAMLNRISERYEGVAVQKVWAFGNLQVDTGNPYGIVGWDWHVAPYVTVTDGDSSMHMVIDPTVADGPVTSGEWWNILTAMTDERQTGLSVQITDPGVPPINKETGKPYPGLGYWLDADPTWPVGLDAHAAYWMAHYQQCAASGTC